MTLDTLPPRRPETSAGPVRRVGVPRDRDGRQRGLPSRSLPSRSLPSRSLLVALALACVTLMVVDEAGGDDSPLEPARRVVGEVVGPAQAGASAVVGPIAALPDSLRTHQQLRDDLASAEAENAALRNELASAGYDENRVKGLRRLQQLGGDLGYAMVPARVVATGSAQSFDHTVTIDAGSEAGLRPDLTVIAPDGLVGRITSVTSHTAVVRLVVDAGYTVGARLGDNMELGLVHGSGKVGGDERLNLQLSDETVVPEHGQAVVTFGSEGGGPHVAGVPIGEVTTVYESVRETTYRAVIDPFVDFTSLDLVGIVVPSGSDSNRPVLEPDGSIR